MNAQEYWKRVSEDVLIDVYVGADAENMSREDALKLALERDAENARLMGEDASTNSQRKEVDDAMVTKSLQMLGFN